MLDCMYVGLVADPEYIFPCAHEVMVLEPEEPARTMAPARVPTATGTLVSLALSI